MSDSFTVKKLRVTLINAKRNFGSSGKNTLVLEGFRVHFSGLTAQGGMNGISNQSAHIQIFGMADSDMNDLYFAGVGTTEFQLPLHRIIVEAGDINGYSIVHQSNITVAQQDFNAQPNACFAITTQDGYVEALMPISSSSFPGSWKVLAIIEAIAGKGGLSVVDQGIPDVMVENAYFHGGLREQIGSICHDHAMQCEITEGKVYAWANNGPRKIEMAIIGPDSGLIGYPMRDAVNVLFRCVFNPLVRFFSYVTIESSLPAACGKWKVLTVQHTLMSETPGGLWMSDVVATKFL